MSTSEILDRVHAVIEERRRQRPEGSYVVQLLDDGLERIAAKVREESGELLEAAALGDREHVAHETADLLFHVWVLLARLEVAPAEVYGVLERRFGIGGLVEKASRGPRC